MGLDMYLKAKHGVYPGLYPEDKDVKVSGIAIPKGKELKGVEIAIGYWRKANAIHGWFVKNTQDGEDRNGDDSYVPREKLKELLDICVKLTTIYGMDGAEAAGDEAMKLLPPTEGFFFGTYRIDEGYWQDINLTIGILTEALTLSERWSIYYQSSW